MNIPPINLNSSIIDDDKQKTEAFNDYFASQSNIDDSNKLLPRDDIPPDRRLSSIVFDAYEVKDILQTLNVNKASGPDAISGRILKPVADIIAKPLRAFFNLSLRTKFVPSAWKLANVTPCFKNDDKSILSNYRPISLLSVMSKVFERCVYKHVFNFIRVLITEHQSGFMPNDSTRNQLLYICNVLSKALDKGKDIRFIFFDISKAFDRLWHKRLLYK
ncbi:unnamed protein product [Mytilus edulis]|uniref:Reverse transcriptase domain-containing protein n=1 Tax=Mytilus edulis TaxID=6550 RepID=A0A8S3QH43_MYTED|nr:unnamed protein product [Mytilus edulis]